MHGVSESDLANFDTWIVVLLSLAGWGFSARVGFSSGGGVFQPGWGFLGITGGGRTLHEINGS